MDSAPDAVLHWERGTLGVECERAAVVREGVEAYLGRNVFVDVDGQLVIRVALARSDSEGRARMVATVTQADASGQVAGERIVTGDDTCASLDEQLTLVVALMVDRPPSSVPDSAPVEAPPKSPSPPPEEPQLAAPDDGPREILTAPSLEQSQVAPGHAAFLALGLLSMGSLPEAGSGASGVALLKPRGFWGFGVEGGLLFEQQRAIGAGRLDVWSLHLRASLCPLQGVGTGVWWSLCASMGAQRLSIESHGLIGAKARHEWIALPGASARAAWVLDARWLLGGGLEAAFPVSADRYVYRDSAGGTHQAFEMSPLGVSANLGVGLLVD